MIFHREAAVAPVSSDDDTFAAAPLPAGAHKAAAARSTAGGASPTVNHAALGWATAVLVLFLACVFIAHAMNLPAVGSALLEMTKVYFTLACGVFLGEKSAGRAR